MRIAALGTSANPPHNDHVFIAREILKRNFADEVWLVPCRSHVFNKPLWPRQYRWKMTKLLEERGVRACDIEINKPGKSYTLDSVLALKKKYPQHTFYWIVGSDLIVSGEYKKWKSWPRLKKEIQFLLIKRPGYAMMPATEKCFIKTGICGSNLSSTLVRKHLKKSLPIDSLVPKKIAQYLKYLKKNHLIKDL
ncbi:nicotinate-nicotinamide nucleotide adenylyltransferase [Patescibacteria group bacterium AH-259-L05]|nr:nicotinate-nicotinamide nucleotide adenylyltransferase [Patescibacteria group bacterium AH-259-L05]